MSSRIVIGLLAVVASVPGSGCAAAWVVGRASGVEWSTSGYEQVQPSVEREREVRLEPRYVPVPPPAVVEAPPVAEVPAEVDAPLEAEASVVVESPPVVLESPSVVVPPPAHEHPPTPEPPHESPAPAIEVPLPEGSLGFNCALRERPVTERVRRTEWRYEKPIWPLVLGLVVIGEAIVATSLIRDADRAASIRERNQRYGVGAAVALDALGLALIAFHPEEEETREWERRGTWTETRGCPDDLWVAHGDTQVRIYADGTVPPPVGHELLVAFARPDTPLRARWGTRELTVRPSAEARCTWAREQHVEAPQTFCAAASDAPFRPPERLKPLTLLDPALPLPVQQPVP